MKTLLLSCLGLLSTISAHAWSAVAPVTFSATVTSTDGPYYSGSKVTVKSVAQRIGNREILEEAVAQGLIPSIEGLKIVCLYEARMEELLLEGHPRFYASNKNGSYLRSLDSILHLDQLGTTGSGNASVSRTGKVSGTLNRRVLFQLTANYQGSVAVCYGQLSVPLRIVGTESEYYGVAGAATLSMNGYVEDEVETMVALSLKFSAFKQE